MWRVLLGFAAIAAFVGLLFWGSQAQLAVECEVCMSFNGRTKCSTARSSSEQLAVQDAVGNACSFLGSGVTDALQCNATFPRSARCREL